MLGDHCQGAHVLDLFAGTGALGIEALSRGALHATFVEKEREALAALRSNIASLGVESRSTIIPANAFTTNFERSAFELVFLDPPYGENLPLALARIMDAVTPRGVVCVESAAKSKVLDAPAGFEVWKSRTYGDTRIVIFRREDREGE
jgi:16S rRNA (guanine966-N2)-methyltransferase